MGGIFKKLFGGSTNKNEPEFAKAPGAQGSAAKGTQWVSGPQGAPLFCGEKTGTLIVCGGNALAPIGKSYSVI